MKSIKEVGIKDIMKWKFNEDLISLRDDRMLYFYFSSAKKYNDRYNSRSH